MSGGLRGGSVRKCGFTLIELLAVIAMFALIAAMVVPNLDLGGSRAVNAEAEDLRASLELARDRAIMTGRVHAVVVDMERGVHWIEWAAPAAPKEAAPPEEAGKLDLVPPPLEGTDQLVPLEGQFGRPHRVEDPAVLLGVEIDGGIAETGEVVLRIDGDGATDPASILVGDANGDYVLRVEVEPLADSVAINRVE